jgi:3-deoxy-D-manno-octulosonic-acid transferase
MAEDIWRAVYSGVGVPLMATAVQVGALWDAKTRTVRQSRRDWAGRLERELADGRAMESSLWFHTTSVGEFEQAKPLLAALYDEYRLVVTCFSPSVASALNRYPLKDAALTIPLDSHRAMRRFFDLVRPKGVVFSKFDVWPNAVWEASRRRIPVALIAGTMHAKSTRLRPIARHLLAHVHKHFAVHCCVTEADAARLRRLAGPDARIVVTGDTRFDQVYARVQGFPDTPLFPKVDQWRGFTVVAGSTYEDDEAVLIPAFLALRREHPDARLVLVPHEPTTARLRFAEDALRSAGLRRTRLTEAERGADVADTDALLVDRVGLLARLYTLGEVAFVGGSFHLRIHNVMEPAVLAKPVLMGPKMDNAPEAYGLLERDAAVRVDNADTLADAFIGLASDPQRARTMGESGRDFIHANLGASERTLVTLRESFLSQETR